MREFSDHFPAPTNTKGVGTSRGAEGAGHLRKYDVVFEDDKILDSPRLAGPLGEIKNELVYFRKKTIVQVISPKGQYHKWKVQRSTL